MYLIQSLVDKNEVLAMNNDKRRAFDEPIDVAATPTLPPLWLVLHYIKANLLDGKFKEVKNMRVFVKLLAFSRSLFDE